MCFHSGSTSFVMIFYSFFKCFLLIFSFQLLSCSDIALASTISDNAAEACDSLISLGRSLYRTKDNILNLTRAFYPPHIPGIAFLRVTYQFENETKSLDGCSVTYVWAKGGFFVIQPPSVFQFTSLLFNHKERNSGTLALRLPSACRQLILANGSQCSCNPQDGGALELLTHQLRLYAKYADVSRVVQDETIRTYAVCETELNKDFYILKGSGSKREVVSFLLIIVLAPLVSIAFMAVIVRSESRNIQRKIRNSTYHPNVAGMVITGMYVTIYIIALDIAACYYAIFGYHELNNIHTLNCLNIASTAILLILDFFSCVPGVIVLVYICSSHCYCGNGMASQGNNAAISINNSDSQSVQPLNKCNKWVGKLCLNHFFAVILGNSANQAKLFTTKSKSSQNNRLVWIMTLSYVTPLFALSSHIPFILVSWLTDTAKASSVALTGIVVLVYLFLMFRQCYKVNSDFQDDSHCVFCSLLCYPIKQCMRFCCAPCCKTKEADDAPRRKAKKEADKLLENTGEWESTLTQEVLGEEAGDNAAKKTEVKFNTKALCIVCSWSWIFPFMAALMIFAFAELPITTFDVLSNLLTTFQVFVVVLSLLITYKILNVDDTNNLNRFFRNLRDTYLGEKKQDMNPLDASGCIVGELAEVVIHRLSRGTPTKTTLKTTDSIHSLS